MLWVVVEVDVVFEVWVLVEVLDEVVVSVAVVEWVAVVARVAVLARVVVVAPVVGKVNGGRVARGDHVFNFAVVGGGWLDGGGKHRGLVVERPQIGMDTVL